MQHRTEPAPPHDQQARSAWWGGTERPTKVALLESLRLTASGSTPTPPTSSLAWLSTRMSAKNTPLVGWELKSPARPLRQNVWPSTSVTRLTGSPRLVGSVCQHPRAGMGGGGVHPPMLPRSTPKGGQFRANQILDDGVRRCQTPQAVSDTGRDGTPCGRLSGVADDDYTVIKYEVDDPVASITLNRPRSAERLGAGDGRRAARRRWPGRPPTRRVVGIVITGEGRGFCAGADMNMLAGIGDGEGRRSPSARPSGDDRRLRRASSPTRWRSASR